MTMLERISVAMDRFFDRIRHRAAFEVAEEGATGDSLEPIRGSKYVLLVTFRRNGEAVPSPVWCALDDQGRGYIHSHREAGKVKRIRNDDRVLIAASTMRGRPKGPVVAGRARVLPEGDWPRAESVLAAAYGPGRKAFEATFARSQGIWTYLEVTPRGAAPQERR